MSLIGRTSAAAACLLLFASAPPLAAEDGPVATVAFGLGLAVAPEYFGSETLGIGPTGAFTVEELILPGGFGLGTEAALPTDPGSGFRGAFRFVPGRSGGGAGELEGLDGIDPAVELGLGLFRVTERMRVFTELRKGFGGHDGWAGEAGLDLLLRPSDRLVLSAGPRAYFGDRGFMRTYFGVSRAEAERASLTAFRPEGGLVSLGIELNARHYFAEGWSLLGTLGWRRVQADAARSPITQQGSADQYRARFILTRTFSFGR